MTSPYQDLQTLGLSPNQATVYLALARSGPSRAGKIIKRTSMHRNLVYVALQELIERNLVASGKIKGVAIFKTLSFARLLEEPRHKERLAKRLAEDMARIAHKATSYQEIVVHEGIDELRRNLIGTYDRAPSHSLIRHLGFSPHWNEVIDDDTENQLIRLHLEKEIQMRAIAKSLTQEQKRYAKRTKGFSLFKISPIVSDETNEIEILDDRISIRLFAPPFSCFHQSQKNNKIMAQSRRKYYKEGVPSASVKS